MTDSDSGKNNDEQSGLDRYLAKKKAETEDPGIADGAPARPPHFESSAPPPPKSPEPPPAVVDRALLVGRPAGFWIRACAQIVDWVIAGAITGLIGRLIFTHFFASFIVIFFYYGWFYAERGATPGKMLFGLRIGDAVTGEKLTYGRTFFRETFGKFISLTVFGMGFIIVGFRADKKGLHDMIFDTQVRR